MSTPPDHNVQKESYDKKNYFISLKNYRVATISLVVGLVALYFGAVQTGFLPGPTSPGPSPTPPVSSASPVGGPSPTPETPGTTDIERRPDGSLREIRTGKTHSYYDLSAKEHAEKAEALKSAGYRPLSISIAKGGYTALWRRSPGPPFVVSKEMSGSEYQRFWETWKDKGYVEVISAAYGSGGDAVFSSVMEQRNVLHMAYFGLTAAELAEQNDRAKAQNLIPAYVTAYGGAGDIRYTAAWVENVDSVEWDYTVNQTLDELSSERKRRDDAEPGIVTISSDERYTAIWMDTPERYIYWGYSIDYHSDHLQEALAKGYEPIWITASQVGSESLHTLIAGRES